ANLFFAAGKAREARSKDSRLKALLQWRGCFPDFRRGLGAARWAMPYVLDTPGQTRLRLGRRSLPGHAYFITFTTHGRQRLFGGWETAAAMARLLDSPGTWPHSNLLAWVLMPDHFHGLLVLAAGTLALSVGQAKGRSARRFNPSVGRVGPVWARSYHDRAIRGDEALRSAARYLVANPLRAGLAKRVGDYPFWNARWLTDESPL
ncbi:MAG TPA: transposase, partial [Arenimonas sp.]|uniref:REP-associated tyrosine transposase n=1 Tax=Arenimonas sp. TaxID=1872635 RepID=UPI002D80CB37